MPYGNYNTANWHRARYPLLDLERSPSKREGQGATPDRPGQRRRSFACPFATGMLSPSNKPSSATVQRPRPASNPLTSLARPGRFERPTFGSVDRRSIQLSYGRVGGPCITSGLSCTRELKGMFGLSRGLGPGVSFAYRGASMSGIGAPARARAGRGIDPRWVVGTGGLTTVCNHCAAGLAL